MKKIILSLVCLSILLLLSCAGKNTITTENINKIKVGSSKQQVIAILGKPDGECGTMQNRNCLSWIHSEMDMHFWTTDYVEHKLQVFFDENNKVIDFNRNTDVVTRGAFGQRVRNK